MADQALPLKWHIVSPRSDSGDPRQEVYATIIPRQLREFTAHLLRTDAENCEVVVNPRYEPNTLQGMSFAAFQWKYIFPSSTALEHPLVPKEWHGLCYYPLVRQKMPAPYKYAYFRGICAGKPVEGVGYAATNGRIVRVGNVEVAVEDPEWPYDAIFAWRPIPDCDWEKAEDDA